MRLSSKDNIIKHFCNSYCCYKLQPDVDAWFDTFNEFTPFIFLYYLNELTVGNKAQESSKRHVVFKLLK